MKMNKYVITKKIVFSALLAIMLSCVILGYSIIGNKKSDAYSAVPTDTTAGVIYDFENYCYNIDNLNTLSTQILRAIGNQGTTLNDLITYAKNTAGEMGKPIGGNSEITLQYGRYRFSNKSSYKDLAWMPVYLSRSTSGDAILTLYLAATDTANKSTSQQEAGYFAHDGNYSTNTGNRAPSNSYSTSHMRVVSLGNAVKEKKGKDDITYNQYATYLSPADNSDYSKLYPASLKESNYNKFSDFIVGSDFEGVLFSDIVAPAEIKWQATESYADPQYNLNEGVYSGYCWPNESYNTPSTGTFYKDTYFDYAKNNKTNYDSWKNDKVWLPSLTEVGTGDISDDGNGTLDTTNGIWKLTASKRSNTISSWLRTANTMIDRTSGHSTYSMFVMDKNGKLATEDVNKTLAIRPAIHLNLSRITGKTTAPVNLPKEVISVYTGDFQSMMSVPAENRKWYSADDMTVYFYIDEQCTRGTVPLNAGTYYMTVELKGTSKRTFFGEDSSVRFKTTKFIVEKAKIGVRWVYEDDLSQISPPEKVELVGEFHQRDINAQNVPEIGMKYSNVTGAGIQNSPEWPDKIGWYKAVAYIVDDDIHNYNYELISEYQYKDKDGNTVKGDKLESHQFEVLQKKIPQPCFKENGDTTLNLGYKGKQYIQIENVSSYIDIVITATASGKTPAEGEQKAQAALDKIIDMGIVDGVQTYAIESVARYTFTITLVDTVNTVWENSGSDTSSRQLTLDIDRAEITVSIEGLPSSWESARNVEFTISALGIYKADEEIITFTVAYYKANTYAPINVAYENGKYVFKANTLEIGDYYIYVILSNDLAYTSNYQMKDAATQKFAVVQTVANFTPQLVNWKYKVGGTQSPDSYTYDEHNTESKALELDYRPNGFYEFSLSLTESQLKQRYVKAEYSGDTYVNDAGMHSVTVTISAYDKNVEFRSLTYTIYFKIAESKFDLSGIEWDYTSPFTYTGNEFKVKINPDTLPEGLTVVYNTGGVATNAAVNAGDYVTAVTFKVSDEYAKNYIVPNVLDANSYINNGNFKFSCSWKIEKQDITASWINESASSGIFFVPYLQQGDNLVDYSFEHKEGSNWVACSKITSTNSNETYRVTAKLKSENAANYTLSGNTSYEFQVSAGQYAVSVYVEINGKRCDDGAQIDYTGEAVTAKPVVESSDISISSYTVEYYTAVSGAKGQKLSDAPKTAGKYIAVISSTFAGGNAVGFQNDTEFSFEIVKADVNISQLKLIYTHGGISVTATWDLDQLKWVDANGKEVVFSFEYDGTPHEIQISGEDSVPGFIFNSLTGNRNTDAGEYTAYIDYTISDNYNDLKLSKSFNWQIRKASVNFENVKWGYIDSDGVEREFGPEGAEFLFTRDDNKDSVKYTVALINLPSYLKNYFRYTTTSYTDHDFGSRNGNSFSAIGEYHTEVTVVGEYPGDKNHASFKETDFPENILKFQDWDIKERELTVPVYDGSWIKFDDKIRDLVDICGMPKNELNYFNVEITFIDKNNTIYNDYQGFDDVLYAARDAGTYIIRFYELLIKYNKDTGEYDDKVEYVWSQIEIEAGKDELEVAWDKNGAIPVAMVKGVYVTGMIGTMYYPIKETGRGSSVTVEYIRTTNGEVTFEAEPYVTKEYANNLAFVMANGEVPVYRFEYAQFNSQNAVKLDKPVIETEKVEYTGNPITFVISDWDYSYKNYLYIVEGAEALTQTDVGVYHVTVSFIKYNKETGVGNACWKTSDPNAEADRSSYELTFEIAAPSRIALDKPTFSKLSDTYTGSAIEFRISNWVLLQAYVDYEVFYKGNTMGKNIALNFINAGIYTLVFNFKDGSKGYWIDDPDRREFTAQLQIIDPNASEQEIMDPVFQIPSKEYTGSQLEFKIDKWDEYYNMHIEIVSVSGGATFTGGTFKATNRDEYTVVVRIKVPGEVFSNGSTEYTLKFTISSPSTGETTFNKSEIKLVKDSDSEYRVDKWSSFGNNLEITCENENVIISGGTIKALKAGTYTVYVNIKSGSNAKWSDGSTTPVKLEFTVDESTTPPVDISSLPIPSLEYNKEFTGDEIKFDIQNWDVLRQYVDIVNEMGEVIGEDALTHLNAGTYKYYLRLKNPDAKWEDGTNTDKEFTLVIEPATITLTTGEDGKPHATNSRGEDVNLNEYLEPKYYDPETGEEVPVDKLEDGKNYDVKYTIKNEEEFNKNISNSSEIKEEIKNTTYNFTYVKPASGVNTLMIIALVEVAVLVVLVIATIVVLAAKRHEYDDDDADDYDDDD